jgi:hypothetical protein
LRFDDEDSNSPGPVDVRYNFHTKKYQVQLFGDVKKREGIEKVSIKDIAQYCHASNLELIYKFQDTGKEKQ